MTATADARFGGSVAKLYESLLVPLIFEPYARDLATRLSARRPRRVLEVAAGTGVVTRAMREVLAPETQITATDLNQAMLDEAMAKSGGAEVEWRQADALALPFPDASFEAVVCQFGVMFFPDRSKGYAEARRVLAPGGVFLFNAWDRIEDNEFADTVTEAVAEIFPADPPRFLARTPHGYHDATVIERDLALAGFVDVRAPETLTHRSRADGARTVAVAYCQGTPLRNEIEQRDAGALESATARAEERLRQRFGAGAIDGRIQAKVVSVTK